MELKELLLAVTGSIKRWHGADGAVQKYGWFGMTVTQVV